jgi:hypothetical protein
MLECANPDKRSSIHVRLCRRPCCSDNLVKEKKTVPVCVWLVNSFSLLRHLLC